MEAATQDYRDEMDLLGQFLADCCKTGPDYSVGATDLYNRYQEWSHEQGIRQPWTQTGFGRALSDRGLNRRR